MWFVLIRFFIRKELKAVITCSLTTTALLGIILVQFCSPGIYPVTFLAALATLVKSFQLY